MSSVGTSLSSSSRRSSSSSSSSSYRSSACYRASTSYRSEGSAGGSGGLRGALGGSGDSLEPLLEPFMDPAGPHHHHHHSLFGEKGPTGPLCLSPFSPYGRASSSFTHSGHSGGAVAGCCSPPGHSGGAVAGCCSPPGHSGGAVAGCCSPPGPGGGAVGGCCSPPGPGGGAVAGCCSPPGPGGGAVGAVCSSGDSYYMSADVSHFLPHHVVVLAYNHCVVIHAEKVLDDGSVSDTFTHKSLLPEDMDPLSVSGRFGPDGVLVVSVQRRGTPPGGDRGPGGS